MKKRFFNKLIIWSLIAGLTLEATPVWALSKDETIYAKLNYNGSVNKVIASEHISDNGAMILNDKSSLLDIKNVNGKETYKEIDKKLVWEANGNDIYYQGNVKKNLPIDVSVKYYLNGDECNVNDMIGKSGNVKIKVKYTNNLKSKQIVNGKSEELYTPFVVSTLTMINNKTNKNIKVTNGKVIDNGINKMIVAISAPGLYESLDIDKLKGFDEVVISYDTDKFELSSIYAVATSKLLDDSDLDIFKDVNKLYNKIDVLSDSSKKLVDGSKKLVNGASALEAGASEMVNGIDSAYKGSSQINAAVKESITKLEKESGTGLDDKTIEAISAQAVSKATLSEEQLAAIGEQAVQTIKNSPEYINLQKQLPTLQEQYVSLKQLLTTEQDPSKVAELTVQFKTIETTIGTYKMIMETMEKTARQTAMATASTVSTQVASQVSKNVASSVGASVKKEMGSQVVSSLGVLSSGLNDLNNGLFTLKKGMVSLYDGTKELDDGLKTLNSGLVTFNNDGVKKISSIVNNDVKSIEGKMKAMIKLSNEYKTLDDITDDSDGSSKIIMVIDGIQLEEEKVSKEAVIEEDKGIIEKIKGLFK